MYYSKKQALKHAKCEIGMFVHIVKFCEVPLTALQKIMLFAVLISQSTQHANYRKIYYQLGMIQHRYED